MKTRHVFLVIVAVFCALTCRPIMAQDTKEIEKQLNTEPKKNQSATFDGKCDASDADAKKCGELSIDKCRFDYNITVNEFKKEFSLQNDPKLMITDENRPEHMSDQALMKLNRQYYEFKEYGIRVFFDMEGRFKSFTFNKPYSGKIGGIRIGDSLDTIKKIKGAPQKNDSGSIIYNSAGGVFYNYETIRGQVSRIFSNRGD